MTPDELAVKVEARRREMEGDGLTWVRPLSSLASEIRGRTEKIHTGIESIDRRLKGFRVGEFAIIAGIPHHGKSLLALTIVYNNPDVPILWVTPDEPRAKVLSQLAAFAMGRSYDEDLEEVIENGGPEADEILEQITDTLRERFPKFVVIGGERLGIKELGEACDEFTTVVGEPPKLLVYDYLRQLPTASDFPGARSEALKAFGYKAGIGILAIHQVKKGAFEFALEPDASLLSYEGEKEAFQILWATREALINREEFGGEPEERQPTIRVFILKNKSGRLLKEGKLCAINRVSGLIEEWGAEHKSRRRG